MDLDSVEVPRNRAASSEPCSTRPNPFDDTERLSRKRQRVSRNASPSRSVDITKAAASSPETQASETGHIDVEAEAPHTPTNKIAFSTETTSSKVTINLRKAPKTNVESEIRVTPRSPSGMASISHDPTQPIISKGPCDDSLMANVPTDTFSSSPSTMGSPKIEVITVIDDDDDDFRDRSPPVAILDDSYILDTDPMEIFPFHAPTETLTNTVRRIVRFFEFEQMEDESAFDRLHYWIEKYLYHTAENEASWHRDYIEYREFWDAFPEIIWALSRRRSFFGEFLRDIDRTGRQSLSTFFHHYALLTARFVRMDLRTMTRYDDDLDQSLPEPVLASRNYLSAFSWLLRRNEVPHIGRNLEIHYQWNWMEDMSIMLANFLRGGADIPALTGLIRRQLSLATRFPKLMDHLTDPCRVVVRAVLEASSILSNSESPRRQYIETCQATIASAFRFFTVFSAGLVPVIEKHVTILLPDAALPQISSLTGIFDHAILHESPKVVESIEAFRLKHPQFPAVYIHTVLSMEWKFEMLKKLITSGQMQLRVAGVTTMCTDLLNMFTKHKRDEPAGNALLQHFARFVLDNELVDYIVGPGSHPEIISESANIVGFLIAIKFYSSKQTDTIWHTVMTSQDPRVVEATLRMLSQILNLYDREGLLYLCRKVEELPIEAFTGPMREYCERLLNSFIQKAISEKIQYLESPPYELCVRLIRESSVSSSQTPLGFLDVQQFASAKLHDLLLHGPEAEVRNSIYVSCIKDIAERKPTAPGSICALLALLRQNMATDLRILTVEHGLTRLIIEELESTSANERGISADLTINTPARQARRDLLLSIIIYEPSSIGKDLGRRLWEVLVGREARSSTNREVAWQILNSAAKKGSSKNTFISTCFTSYLLALEPQYYTIGALDFAREAVVAWLSDNDGDLLDEKEHEASCSVEQLWRMILTAPKNSIEGPAINMLVELYVESHFILSMSRTRAHTVHLALVSRCLAQLSAAAEKLKQLGSSEMNHSDGSMVLVPSDTETCEQKRIFTRSLILLREFLRLYQSKAHFATPKPKVIALDERVKSEGEPVEFRYQTFDGNNTTEIKVLTLSSQNTLASLIDALREATGSKIFRMFHWGEEIDLGENNLSTPPQALKLEQGLVLIQRLSDNASGVYSTGASNLELEIIRHFDDFWEYLGMEDSLAQEIYYFLIKFPIYEKLLASFNSADSSHEDIFALGQPFKCLYAIHALREHLATQVQKGTINSSALSKSANLIVSAIINQKVLNSCANEDLRYVMAQHLLDSLTQLIREPLPVESLALRLDGGLLDRLLQLLQEARVVTASQNSVALISSALEAILEASQHSEPFWEAFRNHTEASKLLQELLLTDDRSAVRKDALRQLAQRCSYTSSLARVSAIEFAKFFWTPLAGLIPQAARLPTKGEETLSLGLVVFRKLADTSIGYLDLPCYLLQWGSLLARHKSKEDVGDPDFFDSVTRGLANLLYWCVSFVKASRRSIPPNNLAFKLFRQHLFPEIMDTNSEENIAECVPLLSPMTRKLISDTILFLTKDDPQQYGLVVQGLTDLLPFEKDEPDPYAMELSFNFDRSRSIRSPTGYVGLRNLSNTCYLNSLFTQLFMNISFREFMLNAYIAEADSAQKLLFETQKLFAFMQNSLRRFVDPFDLTGSIRTYDETAIDVSVQMDVDEFYNLLFDRWEGQILAPEHKKTFRSFYGGHLVQQVKSKECPHISERLEPFSAIQCDIKGKASLQESLQAYVDGEVMEGDNKYKCSTCDRHVNAVKRACLKDIPDNLIFHLKRFDFNLRTMQRNKINDYFSFPHSIDMRPYKVEHLMESPDAVNEDIFELVGILVHSGTAESGHYYSYIRERPSDSNVWVEFNDDNVSLFDPSCIEANCFGGVDCRGPENDSFQFEKSWSAYMLFYQRSSSLQAQQQKLKDWNQTSPVRLPINPRLSNYIASENELLLRKYCLYDDSHALFILKMLENLRHTTNGHCSTNHEVEKAAMSMTLRHFDQVVTRTKDLPDLADYVLTLSFRFQTCEECCRDFLEWLITHAEAFRQLLFKNPDSTVRNEVATAVIRTLSKVKQDASYAYGVYHDTESDDGIGEDAPPRLFQKVLGILDRFWDQFHLNTKAWPEYFTLLANMVHLGHSEAALILDHGFLRRVLDVIRADSSTPINQQYSRMLAIISKRPITKPVSFGSIIELLDTLLRACDLEDDWVDDDECRHELLLENDVIPLNSYEFLSLTEVWNKGNINILVEKLLRHNQNERATGSIIAMLLNGPPTHHQFISNAIKAGIQRSTTAIPSTPFLRAALIFCARARDLGDISDMVQYVAKVTRELENADGAEYLRFFKDLHHLRLKAPDVTQADLYILILDQIPTWSPRLLCYYDPAVRSDTEDYVQRTIFRHRDNLISDISSEDRELFPVVTEAARNLGVECLRFLNEEHVQPRVNVVKANLLSIQAVIHLCKSYYDETSSLELDSVFVDLLSAVIPSLKRLTVEEIDDEVSEWENSEDAFSSSGGDPIVETDLPI